MTECKEERVFTHPAVLIELAPLLTAAGTDLSFRAQNQTLIADGVRSTTYQPPPLLLNAGPNELDDGEETEQPLLPLDCAAVELQSLKTAVLE